MAVVESVNDERTPLLSNSTTSSNTCVNDEPNVNSNHGDAVEPENPRAEKFNLDQVLLLSFCRMIDPITFFCIVPFINQMIEDIGGYPEEDIGFYVGLIESLFSLVQVVVMIPYGRMADKFGRKPVLVWSMAGLLITSTLFGFSASLWQMIVLRCAAGFFSGSVVIRAMISENSTPTTQATAFSYFAFFGNIGIFAGPLVGALADPAHEYKDVFGGVTLFEKYPYCLPTLVTGVLNCITLLIVVFFVKETLEPERHSGSTSQFSTWTIIKSPGVPIVLFIWCIIALLGFAFTAVSPVFRFTSVELGGLGFSPKLIAWFLALGGLSQALYMLFLFPWLQPRIGTGALLRICAVIWPFLFLMNPVTNILLKCHLSALFWIVAILGTVLGSGCAMAFTGSQLAVNDISPSPAALGTLNGVALSLSSLVRAFTPGLFASIFAIGVRHQILWGYLVWFVMCGFNIILLIALYWLPDKINEVPRKKRDQDENDETESQ